MRLELLEVAVGDRLLCAIGSSAQQLPRLVLHRAVTVAIRTEAQFGVQSCAVVRSAGTGATSLVPFGMPKPGLSAMLQEAVVLCKRLCITLAAS
jgi:hypothetical protein